MYQILSNLQTAFGAAQSHFFLPSGARVKISLNLRCIAHSGPVCVRCGCVGTEWQETIVKQTPTLTVATLNLFGWRDGEWVMMTADHIKPRHHGGSDALNNLQTMCQPCNGSKGHKFVANK
jgi:hypothetical protein